MELTIERALQQGVDAHKSGNLKEAERTYQAILQSQPKHPDANHNLGLIAISVNQIEAALSLFKTALNVNPNVEQFWVSYIDALVKAQHLKDAKQAIKKAKKKGFDAKKLQALLSQPKGRADTKVPSEEQLNSLLKYYQTQRYSDAEKLAMSITQEFPKHQLGWKVLGALYGQSGRNSEAVNANQTAIVLSPHDAEAHNNLGNTLKELERLDEAEASYTQAIALQPDYAEAYFNLGNTLQKVGRLDEAIESFKQAIVFKPDYAKARMNLNYAARSAVPVWHLAMMNDEIRNRAYSDALKLAVGDGDVVLDIGTGSGLLSLMAAASGAEKVITCETSGAIAQVAKEIIDINGYSGKISVLNKKSTDLVVGVDLPQRADLIISEVLSSEFVGEGVRTTILDANKRLLKKGGRMIPQSGKIRIALIENSPEIFNNTSVSSVHGYDLSEFNSISQSKFNLKPKDNPILLSNSEDAFNINLYDVNSVVGEEKIIELRVNRDGLCVGLIQWIWIHLYKEIEYENKPGENDSHWTTPIYLFDQPVVAKIGDVLEIKAVLGKDYVWFCQLA